MSIKQFPVEPRYSVRESKNSLYWINLTKFKLNKYTFITTVLSYTFIWIYVTDQTRF